MSTLRSPTKSTWPRGRRRTSYTLIESRRQFVRRPTQARLEKKIKRKKAGYTGFFTFCQLTQRQRTLLHQQQDGPAAQRKPLARYHRGGNRT